MIEGVLFMQEGVTRRVLGDMLASFVSPKSPREDCGGVILGGSAPDPR